MTLSSRRLVLSFSVLLAASACSFNMGEPNLQKTDFART